MHYHFVWDPNKAKDNRKKHKVSFDEAAGIFLDPRAVSVFDAGHSDYDDRWVTMGIGLEEALLVVIHTFEQIDRQSRKIRIISARKATRKEAKQYREENP